MSVVNSYIDVTPNPDDERATCLNTVLTTHILTTVVYDVIVQHARVADKHVTIMTIIMSQ